MPDSVNDIILEELRGIRSDVKDFRSDVQEGFSETKQRLTALETVTEPFFANEGGKSKIQEDIDGLKRSKYMVLGGAGAITTLGHYILHFFGTNSK